VQELSEYLGSQTWVEKLPSYPCPARDRDQRMVQVTTRRKRQVRMSQGFFSWDCGLSDTES
jgi:hypothetical protein